MSSLFSSDIGIQVIIVESGTPIIQTSDSDRWLFLFPYSERGDFLLELLLTGNLIVVKLPGLFVPGSKQKLQLLLPCWLVEDVNVGQHFSVLLISLQQHQPLLRLEPLIVLQRI